MALEIPKLLLCWSCGGRGLVLPGTVCAACDGIGAYPRFRVALPVLRVHQGRADGSPHRRILVLGASPHGVEGQLLVHGLTVTGDQIVVPIKTAQLEAAPVVDLEELGAWV